MRQRHCCYDCEPAAAIGLRMAEGAGNQLSTVGLQSGLYSLHFDHAGLLPMAEEFDKQTDWFGLGATLFGPGEQPTGPDYSRRSGSLVPVRMLACRSPSFYR